MRVSVLISLLITSLFAAGFFYVAGQGVCQVPISYRLGNIDERFSLSAEEARAALAEAEAVWEAATGEILFTYDETAPLAINFVFDERQAFTDAEADFKDRLDRTENLNDTIAVQYESLVVEYNELRNSYLTRSATYEAAITDYNDRVAKYNASGGAPPDVYAALQQEEIVLQQQQRDLNQIAKELNVMVDEINSISSEGNQLIETYNRGVVSYNQTFSDSREFTQGDYQGSDINVYTFSDDQELSLVLAHEFGHALGIDHVAGSSSIMYYLIGEQPKTLVLSHEDQRAFQLVCGTISVWDRIVLGFTDQFGL